ncbi:MAG: hypothetical protein ACYS8K_09870, partial [Planctomycetota bacterium]
RLESLQLGGLTDITLRADLTLGALCPRGVPRPQAPAVTEWFWREFAAYLRAKGFRNIFLIAPSLLGRDSLSEEWFALARRMQRAGWSVCGPYDQTVLTPGILGRLGELSSLVILNRAGIESLMGMRDVLPAGTRLGLSVAGPPLEFDLHRARHYVRKLAESDVDLIAFSCAGLEPRLGSRLPSDASGRRPAHGERCLRTLAWAGIRDGLDEVNYLRMVLWYERRSAQPPGGQPPQALPADVTKRELLQRLSMLFPGDLPGGVSLYWNDLPLVVDGEPRAEIALDARSPWQRAQAEMLNGIVNLRTGITLPVRGLRASSPRDLPVVLLLGTPQTNADIAALFGARSDLDWRLQANGHMFLEVRRGPRTYLALMSADPVEWGRPIVAFKAMLRQEGGWVRR